MKKILFICSANRLRSRTAFEYFSKKFEGQFIIDSCGMNAANVKQTQQMFWPLAKSFTKDLYQEADYVFCMEHEHTFEIMRRNKDGEWNLDLKKCYTLEIEDIYEYNDSTLIAILEDKVVEYLESTTPNTKYVPEQFKEVLKAIPLRIKIRSVLKQNDKANWIDGEYKGDLGQLENTVKALEEMVKTHFEA